MIEETSQKQEPLQLWRVHQGTNPFGQEATEEAQERLPVKSLGQKILDQINRRDRAYYYWSILAFIFSFLPFMIAYPPWQFSGQYYPNHYDNLGFLSGYDPQIEVLRSATVRIALGIVARFYFWLVETRDTLLFSTLSEEQAWAASRR